jgi:hypothetical protein
MSENSNVPNTDELKRQIKKLDDESLSKMAKDVGVKNEIKNLSKKEIVDEIINSNTTDDLNKLFLLTKYFQIYPILSSLSKDKILKSVPIDKRRRFESKEKKEGIIETIKVWILKNTLDSEIIYNKACMWSMYAKINSLKKKDDLIIIAKELGIDIEENDDIKTIKNKIEQLIGNEKISKDNLKKAIDTTLPNKKSNAKSKNTAQLASEVKSLKSEIILMKQEINQQQHIISELASLLSNLDKKMDEQKVFQQNILNKTEGKLDEYCNVKNTGKLLKEINKNRLDQSGILRSDTFYQLKSQLNSQGFNDIDILRDGLNIVTLDYLLNITKRIEWDIDINSFYSVLHAEAMNLNNNLQSSIKIPPLKEAVCKKINISADKFDSLVLQCFDQDFVYLEVGTPIGETDAGWIDTGKNRYYYIKFLKS